MNFKMNLKKTLFIIFASCGLVLPSLQAAEYSQSFSGNVRVESQSTTVNDGDTAIETLTTSFGGDDEASSTGGDTHLQWNHHFASDDGNTAGNGFIRFTANNAIRYNVEASSQLGDYNAALKAEWESNDGFGGDLTGRDQFAILTHSPTGVYYKIGREEWLNNEKGYTTDFLTATKDFSGQAANNRFSLHALGWKGLGLNVALLIQRDSVPAGAAAAASSLGGDAALASPNATDPAVYSTDTNGFGLRVGYTHGAVDAELTVLSGSQNTNTDRGDAEVESTGGVTQLYLAFPIQEGKFTPFLNFGTQTREVTPDVAALAGGVQVEEYSRSGWNLGVSLGLGASDLVLAYGSGTQETNDEETTSSGFDLMWATNQDPLTVALAYTSGTETVGDADPTTTGKYGVRLEYGF